MTGDNLFPVYIYLNDCCFSDDNLPVGFPPSKNKGRSCMKNIVYYLLQNKQPDVLASCIKWFESYIKWFESCHFCIVAIYIVYPGTTH